MATISWERPGVRVVQGVGKSGTLLWINWHFKEIRLGTGLNGPPVVGGEYTAYMDGKRVGDVFHSLPQKLSWRKPTPWREPQNSPGHLGQRPSMRSAPRPAGLGFRERTRTQLGLQPSSSPVPTILTTPGLRLGSSALDLGGAAAQVLRPGEQRETAGVFRPQLRNFAFQLDNAVPLPAAMAGYPLGSGRWHGAPPVSNASRDTVATVSNGLLGRP